VFQHRVQGDRDGCAQGTHHIEDIDAVVASEDSVLMLNGDKAHVAIVDELGGTCVVGLDVLPDLELHLRGVLVLPRRFGHRQHHRNRSTVVRRDGGRKIGGERRNSAAPRPVRADERDRDGVVAVRRYR
jgi:hypothetical protein